MVPDIYTSEKLALEHRHQLLREAEQERMLAMADSPKHASRALPRFVSAFSDKATGQPDGHYLAAVRKRFGQWILDTARANYDQAWLDYQYEIGLRHHRGGKNRTDGVNSIDNVSYRYLPALLYPITTTLKPFLAKKGHSAEDVEKMHQAWLKSVLLQIILWSQPYIKDGEF